MDSRKNLLSALLLALFTLVSFAPCFNNGYMAVDDPAMVFNNQKIFTLTPGSILGYFTSFHRSLYHPLVLLSYALEYHFFNLDPLPYHMVNVLLHCISALLVFALFRILLKDRLAAFLSALLFAVHPLRVESVAWITERKDVLCTVFYAGGMLAWLRYRERGGVKRYLVCAACFLGALLSKPMAVTFPFVLLILDGMRDGRITAGRFREKTVLFALTVVFVAVALAGMRGHPDVSGMCPGEFGKNLLEANYNVLHHVYKSVFPARLSFSYPHYIKDGGLMKGYLAYSPAVTLLCALLLLATLKYSRKPLWGTLFYLTALLPASNIVPFGVGTPGDRLSYLPQIGLIYIVGSGFAAIKARWKTAAIPCALLLFCVAALLSYGTYRRCEKWKNTYRLMSDVVEKYPEARTSAIACELLSEIYLNNLDDKDRSRQYLEKALALKDNGAPSMMKARWSTLRGDTKETLGQYEVLVEKGRYYADVEAMKFCLGNGLPDKALEFSGKAPGKPPEYSWLLFSLRGDAYRRKSLFREAVTEYSKALALSPRDYNTYAARAEAYEALGDRERSEQDKKAAQHWGMYNPNIYVTLAPSAEPPATEKPDHVSGW